MKFLCLGYADEAIWDSLQKGEQEKLMEECFAFDETMHKNGQWVDAGHALQASKTAKMLRWNGEKVVITDGPFAETKEQLGGIGTVEARDIIHAVEILSKHPALRFGPFEVRPLDADMEKMYAERQKLPKPRKIFVNLPVKDLNRSIDFFTKLGFTFNPQFTDETATCMIVATDIFVMLLTEAKFKEFTPKAIADATKTSEVLTCLSCEDRAEVDKLVTAAKAAGGSTFADAKDYGFMYQHGFQDPDGHIWELVWMDPQFAAPQES
jgi:predicted lactoylglutathione lyase